MTETTTPSTITGPAPAPPASRVPADDGHDRLEQVATVVTLPFTVVERLLPDGPVPVALGAGALALAGVVEWPVAAAIGLGYLALRRWRQPAVR